MKNPLIILLLIPIFLIFYFSNKTVYKLNGKYFLLYKATNEQEWGKGLMFYKDKKELNGASGMIFVFPDKNFRTFWNKNTYLDLDIYWLDNDKIVGKDFLPSINKSENIVTIKSNEKVNKVIEIIK